MQQEGTTAGPGKSEYYYSILVYKMSSLRDASCQELSRSISPHRFFVQVFI